MLTRETLADAVSDLLSDRPVAAVRVGDICRKAGVSRQAFYRHFRDKYDLIAWVFSQTALDFTVDTMQAATAGMTRIFHEQRGFYRSALADRSQNSLYSYVRQYYVQKHKELLKRVLMVPALSALLESSVHIYCYGCIDHVREWLQCEADNRISPDAMAESIFCAMPATMRQAYGL